MGIATLHQEIEEFKDFLDRTEQYYTSELLDNTSAEYERDRTFELAKNIYHNFPKDVCIGVARMLLATYEK